jgi:hypothetical protein
MLVDGSDVKLANTLLIGLNVAEREKFKEERMKMK